MSCLFKIKDRPKSIEQDKLYLVNTHNILKPFLMWHVFYSQDEIDKLLFRNKHRRDITKYEVITGKEAIKLKLDFGKAGPYMDNSELAPRLPGKRIYHNMEELKKEYPQLKTMKYIRELNRAKLRKQNLV